jgi:hypothetical protein
MGNKSWRDVGGKRMDKERIGRRHAAADKEEMEELTVVD